jgi:hypothetical protein
MRCFRAAHASLTRQAGALSAVLLQLSRNLEDTPVVGEEDNRGVRYLRDRVTT